MIIDLFMLMIVMAFILFILAVFDENIVFSGVSLLLWIVIFAQAFWIYVPGDAGYTDYTWNALSLAFIFINIIWMLTIHFELGERYRKDIP